MNFTAVAKAERHCRHLKKLRQVSQPKITAVFSTVFFGCIGLVRQQRDIPERYGNHRTISSRFYRWLLAGVWQKVWSSLMQQADLEGNIDWQVNFERQHYSSSTPACSWSKRGEPEAQVGLKLWWF